MKIYLDKESKEKLIKILSCFDNVTDKLNVDSVSIQSINSTEESFISITFLGFLNVFRFKCNLPAEVEETGEIKVKAKMLKDNLTFFKNDVSIYTIDGNHDVFYLKNNSTSVIELKLFDEDNTKKLDNDVNIELNDNLDNITLPYEKFCNIVKNIGNATEKDKNRINYDLKGFYLIKKNDECFFKASDGRKLVVYQFCSEYKKDIEFFISNLVVDILNKACKIKKSDYRNVKIYPIDDQLYFYFNSGHSDNYLLLIVYSDDKLYRLNEKYNKILDKDYDCKMILKKESVMKFLDKIKIKKNRGYEKKIPMSINVKDNILHFKNDDIEIREEIDSSVEFRHIEHDTFYIHHEVLKDCIKNIDSDNLEIGYQVTSKNNQDKEELEYISINSYPNDGFIYYCRKLKEEDTQK